MTSVISDEDFAHGKRAIDAMKSLCRTQIEPLVRTVVRDHKIRVEPHPSRSFTDGKSVFIATPWELGETLEHDKSLCGKRDSTNDLQMLCPACRRMDDVLADAFHETAHLTEDSFERVSGEDILQAVREVFGPILDTMDSWERLTLEGKIRSSETTIEACGYIDTWLGLMANVVEDIFVNRHLGEKRPGTLVQLSAHARKIVKHGASTAGAKAVRWQDAPKDAQAFLPAYLIGADLLDLRGTLPDVDELFDDPVIIKLMTSIPGDSGTVERLRTSMELLNRYRELGYMPRKSDSVMPPPPPPEEPEQEEEETPPPGEPCEDGDPGETEDEAEGKPSEASDDESDEDDDSDDKSGSDGDESDTEDDEESDEDGDGSSEAGDDDEESDSTDEGDAEDGDSTNDEGEDEASEADTESETEDGDAGDDDGAQADDGDADDESDEASSEAGDDDGDEAGDDGTPGSSDDDDAEADPQEAGDDPFDAGDSDEDGRPTEKDGEGDDGDSEDETDGEVDDKIDGDEEDDEGDEAEGDGSPMNGSDAHSDSEDDDDPADDDEATDEEDADEEPMTDDEIEASAKLAEELIKAFTGHENAKPKTADDKRQERALERVFDQSTFDQPSDFCLKFDHVTREDLFNNWGKKPDALEMPEGLITSKLARLRVVFAQNRKTGLQRDLRSGPRLDTGHLHRIPNDDLRIFGRKSIPKKRDWFVMIGLDLSGSTGSNGALHPTKLSGMALAEMLSRLGIAFSLEAHASEDNRNENNGWNLRHVTIKSPDEPWTPDCKRALSGLYSFGCNLDGHSMERYRKIAQARRETDKLIIYFTDGAMPMFNAAEELEILQKEIKLCRQMKIGLTGVGYQTDSPSRHGLETIVYNEAGDIPSIVAGLERHLSKPL